MPTTDELDEAVAVGVIGRAEADRLAQFLARRRAPAQPDDAETIRFVRGFHDIFLTIGIALVLFGVAFTTGLFLGDLGFAAVAAVALALALYFTRVRRLTLPSIALSLAFGISSGYLAGTLGLAVSVAAMPDMLTPVGAGQQTLSGLFFAAGAMFASLGYYLYFRLPFTAAQIAAAFAATAWFLLAVIAPGTAEAWTMPLFLALGTATFALAMHYDLRDPARNTRLADVAFWLHLAAAPLIVNSAMGFVWTTEQTSLSLGDAINTIILIAVLAVVALIIDRRAILVAGLIYFGVALSIIINRTGVGEAAVTSLTVLGLGTALLLLGVGWRSTRNVVVSRLVPPALARRLPKVTTELP